MFREERMDAPSLLQAILDSPTRHGIIVTDPEGKIRLWNRGAERLFQYRGDEIVGRSADVLFPPDDLAHHVPDQEMAIARRDGCAVNARWHVRKDGSLFWTDGMIYPVRSRQGQQLGFVTILRDATEEKRNDEQNTRLALEDSLTGLPNRVEFRHRWVDMRASALRHDKLLVLLLLDLDHFKQVNDRLGHAMGDALLQQAAHRMRAALRDTDFVARLGGDEFVVLIADADSPEVGGAMADKLVATLSRPFHLGEHEAHIGASIGVSVYPTDAEELETLFVKADMAMYRAKAEGRSGYRYYTPQMDASAHLRTQQLVQLRRAVKDRAFCLHWQPRVSAVSGMPLGVEALLRCKDPFFAGVPTEDLLALATETGRMRRLGLWVLAEAIRQVRLWHQSGHRALALTVNCCRIEFTEPRYARRVCDLLARMRMPPSLLEIEVSETQLAGEFDASQLNTLHEAGVALSVDDVGVGGLSLRHLFDLPIDRVKIDTTYLPGLPQTPRSRDIVAAISQLARPLGIRITAERVETPAQAEFLARHCDGLQGRHVAAPMPAEQMTEWLQRRTLSADAVRTPVAH
jgi:diguanylate cyclase (GGDEF)-like protein/PAS domain S-box-containing protein